MFDNLIFMTILYIILIIVLIIAIIIGINAIIELDKINSSIKDINAKLHKFDRTFNYISQMGNTISKISKNIAFKISNFLDLE